MIFDFVGTDPAERGPLRRRAQEAGIPMTGFHLTPGAARARCGDGVWTDFARDADGRLWGRLRMEPLSGRRVIDAAEMKARMPLLPSERMTEADWQEAADLLAAQYPLPATEPTMPEITAPGTSWLRGRR